MGVLRTSFVSIFVAYRWAAGILAVVATRVSCGAALGPADAAAVPVVAAGWSFQEWAIHKHLLHGLEVTVRVSEVFPWD